MSVARGQAEQGATVRLKGRFTQDNGALFDPYEVRKVQIVDDDLTVLANYTSGQLTRESTGLYYVDYAVAESQVIGLYHDVWYWTPISGGNEKTATADFYVHTSGTFSEGDLYITESQARELLSDEYNDTTDDDYVSSARILFCIAWAMETVKRYCRTSFLTYAQTKRLDGSGTPVLFLPAVLQNLTSVTVVVDDYSDAIDTDDLVVYKRKLVYGQWHPGSGKSAAACAPCGCSAEGGIFPKGRQNIHVSGSWGRFPTVPYGVQEAMKRLVRYYVENELPVEPFASETLPDWSGVRRAAVDRASLVNDSTGFRDVDIALNLFRPQSGSVVVI